MLSSTDRHLREHSLRTLATFSDAWHDLDGRVDSSEALVMSAARVAPQDEALLRLRAWSLSWGPLNTSTAQAQHHLQRWLDLAARPAGRNALERLHPDRDGTTLLAAVLPALPDPALAVIGARVLAEAPWWLPLQTLVVLTPGQAHTTLLNAWRSVEPLWGTVPTDLGAGTWLNPQGDIDPIQPALSAWWQLLAGHDGGTARGLMQQTRNVLATLTVQAPVPAQDLRDRALHAGLVQADRLNASRPSPGLVQSRYQAWVREATVWLDDGAHLPHRYRFDLPPSATLPHQGAGWPANGTYDDAVALMDGSNVLNRTERDAWYLLWNVLRPVEARCVERALLRTTAQAALDEEGHQAGHLRARRRL